MLFDLFGYVQTFLVDCPNLAYVRAYAYCWLHSVIIQYHAALPAPPRTDSDSDSDSDSDARTAAAAENVLSVFGRADGGGCGKRFERFWTLIRY